jgi:KRAB domain-containing zinc finger protein
VKCDYCNYASKSKVFLSNHMRLCKEKPINCEVCKTKMLNQFKKVHLEKHHGIYNKTFGCDICGAVYKQKGQIRHHMSQHMITTPFCCSICKQRHTDASNFRSHMKIHNFVENCKVCSKPLFESNFSEHMNNHFNEKSFMCKFEGCDVKFNNDTALKLHLLTHIKPFCCKICSKRYGNKDLYNQHVLLHDNPNTFKCKQCDKVFNFRQSLQSHERIHHQNLRKKCSICPALLISERSLKLHMATHGKQIKISI